MKRIVIWIGLAAVACLVCLWRLPASVMLAALPAKAAAQVQVHRISGTVWQGELLASVTGVAPALPLAWACRPSLSPVGIACRITGGLSGELSFGLLDSTLLAQGVQASVPIQAGVPGGRVTAAPLQVQIKSVQASTTTVELNGSARAVDVVLRLGAAATPLGEVTLDCTPDAAAGGPASRTRCTVGNRGGAARLDGQLTLTTSGASGAVDFTPAGGPRQSIRF
ncbi:MAG: hypothetical protein JNL19_10520 [Burkholderiales bacterium]|nr:hypothetical protein [Burkholderiales bacterium]